MASDLAVGPTSGLTRLGRYAPRALGTPHVAPSDGFVTAGFVPAEDAGGFALAALHAWVDGVLVGTASGGTMGGFDAAWGYVRAAGGGSLLVPVPEGATWQVDRVVPRGSGPAPAAWLHWLPLVDGASLPAEPATSRPPEALPPPGVAAKPWQDLEPAMWELAAVLERIVGRPVDDADKRQLVAAMQRLI